MPTKAELKRLAKPIRLKIRSGDRVLIIAGKDKGEIGTVYAVSPKEQRALVLKQSEDNPENLIPLNAVTKHRKAKQQGERSARFTMAAPIHISNLMILDPTTNEPTRIGRRLEEGKLIRYSKRTGVLLPATPLKIGKTQ